MGSHREGPTLDRAVLRASLDQRWRQWWKVGLWGQALRRGLGAQRTWGAGLKRRPVPGWCGLSRRGSWGLLSGPDDGRGASCHVRTWAAPWSLCSGWSEHPMSPGQRVVLGFTLALQEAVRRLSTWT